VLPCTAGNLGTRSCVSGAAAFCYQCGWLPQRAAAAPPNFHAVVLHLPSCLRCAAAAEHSYLSPSVGEAVMYVNMEDHLTYINGKPNEDFQVTTLANAFVCFACWYWQLCGLVSYAKLRWA
jgi:hypothetical protein